MALARSTGSFGSASAPGPRSSEPRPRFRDEARDGPASALDGAGPSLSWMSADRPSPQRAEAEGGSGEGVYSGQSLRRVTG